MARALLPTEIMFKSLQELEGYKIIVADGEIGKIDRFFIDDEKWAVRYLVVATGGLIDRQKVLISPISVGSIDHEQRTMAVNLSREEILNSPNIDTDRPVSRQHEAQYFEYYRWPFYWTGAGLWGIAPSPLGLSRINPHEQPATPVELSTFPDPQSDRSLEDPHLRSNHEIKGYRIEATDRTFGHLEDLVIETNTWAVRYLVIDTVNWWPSKSVIISPEWVDSISWHHRKLRVDLSEDFIKSCPVFEGTEKLDREYEESLFEHYGRPRYWTREVPDELGETKRKVS